MTYPKILHATSNWAFSLITLVGLQILWKEFSIYIIFDLAGKRKFPYTPCHPGCSYYLKQRTFKAASSTKKGPALAHRFLTAWDTDFSFITFCFEVRDLFFVSLAYLIISWFSDCKNKVHFDKTSFTGCSVWRK